MKKIILILTLLFSIITFSQEIVKQRGRFYVNEKQISSREARQLISKNTEALALFKSSKTKESIGGFLIGFGTATVIIDLAIGLASDVKYPSGFTYVGLSSLLASIPILSGKNKKMDKAIELYNNGLKSTGYTNSDLEFNIIANQRGYGLQLRF